jgi:nicotinic acid mononucleotide adenylyltransferase
MTAVHVSMDPFHLGTLFSLRRLLRSLDPNGPPTIATLRPVGPARGVALLPGSFNPPTAAHLLLAERARSEGLDRVMFLLSVRTVGKRAFGLIPEDRMLALQAMGGDAFSVGACSHGLYADQAEAASAAFDGAEICFLVGSDKVLQIFERRWYGDRDTALERLFTRACLLVAPRSDQSERLRAVLGAPENRRFADRVSILRLHPAVGDLSSTRVRGLLHAGADPAGLVPSAVADLVAQTRAFGPPAYVGNEEVDAYQIRCKLFDLIWRTRGDGATDIDLHRLTTIALSPTPPGASLRTMLANGSARDVDLARAQAAGL